MSKLKKIKIMFLKMCYLQYVTDILNSKADAMSWLVLGTVTLNNI